MLEKIQFEMKKYLFYLKDAYLDNTFILLRLCCNYKLAKDILK